MVPEERLASCAKWWKRRGHRSAPAFGGQKLESRGDEIWNEMNEEWAEFFVRRRQQPSIVNIARVKKRERAEKWMTGSQMRCEEGEGLSK